MQHNLEQQKEEIYQYAKQKSCSNANAGLEEAIKLLSTIQDYKDAADLSKEFRIRLAAQKIKSESQKKSKEEQKERFKKKFLSAVLVLATLGALGFFVVYPLGAAARGEYKVLIDMYQIEEFRVPGFVKEIKPYAFWDCDSLEEVSFGEGVTSIGNDAFAYCSNLEKIELPHSLTSIGSCAFWKCDSLQSISIPDRVTSLGASAFSGCKELTTVEFGDGLKDISAYAFNDCESLVEMIVGNNITTIGVGAFEGCHNLQSVTIADSVTKIEERAFYRTALNRLQFTNTEGWWIQRIDQDAFSPDSVIKEPSEAAKLYFFFYECAWWRN